MKATIPHGLIGLHVLVIVTLKAYKEELELVYREPAQKTSWRENLVKLNLVGEPGHHGHLNVHHAPMTAKKFKCDGVVAYREIQRNARVRRSLRESATFQHVLTDGILGVTGVSVHHATTY